MILKLILFSMLFLTLPSSFAVNDEKPIRLKSVRFDAETTKTLRTLQEDFLRFDRKGNCTVIESYEILEYSEKGEIVIQTKGADVSAYNGKKKFAGITITCAGCSKGCKPVVTLTDGGKSVTFGCSPCGKQTLTGCLAAVKVPVNKVTDRETVDGGRF